MSISDLPELSELIDLARKNVDDFQAIMDKQEEAIRNLHDRMELLEERIDRLKAIVAGHAVEDKHEFDPSIRNYDQRASSISNTDSYEEVPPHKHTINPSATGHEPENALKAAIKHAQEKADIAFREHQIAKIRLSQARKTLKDLKKQENQGF